MIAEFSVFPVGKDVHLSAYVAQIMPLIVESGLTYKMTAMGTIVEGGTDEVFDLIRACHKKMAASCERVITNVKIDDFVGRTGRITGKIESVERYLGSNVNK